MSGVVAKLYYYDTANHKQLEKDIRNGVLSTKDIIFDEKSKSVLTHGVRFGGEIVDNLTTDSSTKILSAGAGKRINDKVETVKRDVTNIKTEISGIRTFITDLIGEEIVVTEIKSIKGGNGIKVGSRPGVDYEKIIETDIDTNSALGYNDEGKL